MKLKVIKLNQVTSTNDKAIEMIRKKNFKPKLLVSKKQTKGKGTMGKKWISREGNLFISYFLRLRLNQKTFQL